MTSYDIAIRHGVFIHKQIKGSSPDDLLRRIICMSAYRKIFLTLYHTLVVAGEINPIESLPDGEKNKLWDIAVRGTRELEVELQTKKNRTEICRALFLLQTVAND